MRNTELPSQPRLRLAQARIVRNLSQQALADAIGTNYVNVSRWERGITKPSPYFRTQLCKFFEKSEVELDLVPASAATTPARANTTTSPDHTEKAVPSVPTQPSALYDPAIPLKPGIDLVGREQDLYQVKQQLCAPQQVAMTALNGLPGVGKTTLAITLAHDPQVRDHFQDGILWAGLGPQPNILGLLSRWGHLLGISSSQMEKLSSTEAWAKAIRNAIGTRKMLLVIDDAWQLEEALTFKVGGPNCAHLVTTRFPYIASHMSINGTILLQELTKEASFRLLEMLAPQVVTREIQKAETLVQAVGGLPLALTLIGNYLRKQAYSGQSRRISAALEKLNDAEVRLGIEEPHVPAESHPSLPIETSLSLQSVINVTDQLLTPATRTTLYALSIFPSKPKTFSEEAALVIAACTIDELDALSDAGLLECTGGDRYTLHQVIADYARVHLSDPHPMQRLIDYVASHVEAHKKDYEILEQDNHLIETALEAALVQDKQTELIQITSAFAPFLILRGFYRQAEYYLQKAHEAALQQQEPNGIAGTFLYLGEVSQKQGNLAQAENYFQQGLVLARQTQSQERICTLLNDLGWVNLKKGGFAQAEAYLQEGLALARQIQDQEQICSLLKILGSVAAGQGIYEQSENFLREGLTIAKRINDREQTCVLLINLGATVGGQGRHIEAKAYYEEGLELARQLGLREQICVLLINLGDIEAEENHYKQAEAYFREGLRLAEQIEHREWTSVLLMNLGMISQKSNDYEQAANYLQQSLSLAQTIGRPRIICMALYEFGQLNLVQRKLNNAKHNFEEMLEKVPSGDQESLALAYYGLSRTLAKLGNILDAKKFGEESYRTFKAMGYNKAKELENWLENIEKI
ncbi:tetratricopeptide repeat protein [Tengunoibacter tsumagoiensis]|uniref:NTPase n=1 Tax=Tengunoibacter tsumagoiensis TaxID=2014871 RepID=A0A401ZXE9_9CHLR|nr:tetratricopeptide repeat protein [Tengunoibacter tsumagoiensis]GCE11519.1 NTPase [Tengunoibacter tsumagoiensis]